MANLNDWSFGNIYLMVLLLLVPLLGFVIFNFLRWRIKRRTEFAESRFQEYVFDTKQKTNRFMPLLYLLGVFFLVFAMVDILSGKEEITTNQRMNSVMFVLDISNSMNAEDIQPSRLTQAKNLMIQTMNQMTSDKVGIVVFAGQATSIMPLTTDYTAAETYISGIETSVMKIQGTDFLKAMQESAKKFKNVSKGSRKVVLISDGEDNEGNEEKAAKLAKDEGITIVSVGVGTDEGAPVPEYVFGQLMGYKTDVSGQTVLSRRMTKALESLAGSTGGSYVDGNDLKQAPVQIINELNKKAGSSQTTVTSQNANHYFQYPLALSVLCFLLIFFLNPKREFNI